MTQPTLPAGSWRLTHDIVLETRCGHRIANGQVYDVSVQERNQNADLQVRYPEPCIHRSGMNPIYNCHGMTFASRRTWIDSSESVRQILTEDCYDPVHERDALPGDIILYVDDTGDVLHSGTVIAASDGALAPTICSKWGKGNEVIHPATRSPYSRHNRHYYRVTR